MTLTQEQIAWGAASMLIRRHAGQAEAHAESRILELTAIGDDEGIRMWKKIACCINQLRDTGTSH